MNDKYVIRITKPKIIRQEGTIIFDYDESRLIYNGQDLGNFVELCKMKVKNEKYKEIIDKAIEYINGAYEMATYTKSVSLDAENIEDLLDILKQEE